MTNNFIAWSDRRLSHRRFCWDRSESFWVLYQFLEWNNWILLYREVEKWINIMHWDFVWHSYGSLFLFSSLHFITTKEKVTKLGWGRIYFSVGKPAMETRLMQYRLPYLSGILWPLDRVNLSGSYIMLTLQ